MNGGFSMTIYETIKAAISVKQAAEHYGLKVSHNGGWLAARSTTTGIRA